MKIEWKSCIKVAVSAFILYLAVHYWKDAAMLFKNIMGAASPLLIGAVAAYLVNILMCFYERHFFPKSKKAFVCKARRPLCMIFSYLSLILTVALVVMLVVPQLVKALQLLIDVVPDTMKDIAGWISAKEILPPESITDFETINWEQRIEQIGKTVLSGIGSVTGAVFSVISSVFSGIVTALLALIFSVYILLGKEKLSSQCDRIMKRYFSSKWYGKIMYVLRTADNAFRNYTVGQCIEAVILGGLCAIGMILMKMPYAGMSGALIAFTALIPIAGAYIGGGICAFMIFTVSPVKALIFIVYLVILQEFEGNIIYPRVVGSSIGLPGIWVLAAVTIGGGIMGVPGMLIGVPLAATAYKILKDDVNKIPSRNQTEDKHV